MKVEDLTVGKYYELRSTLSEYESCTYELINTNPLTFRQIGLEGEYKVMEADEFFGDKPSYYIKEVNVFMTLENTEIKKEKTLDVYYDPMLDDEGRYLGEATLIFQNADKYLSVTVANGAFEVYHEPSNYEDTLSMSKSESFNKVNDLIAKVLG